VLSLAEAAYRRRLFLPEGRSAVDAQAVAGR